MASLTPDDGMCRETSGFLFSHPCDRFSIQQCVQCQKPICEEHGHVVPEGIVCTKCMKRKTQDERQRNPDSGSTTDSYHERHYCDSSPYFYSHHYYPGHGHVSSSTSHVHPASPTPDLVSGGSFDDEEPGSSTEHDPSDFTEGDAGALQREEDEDFESDMGAS